MYHTTEPARARRIRDRARMIARGTRIAKQLRDRGPHDSWDDIHRYRADYGRRNHDHLADCSCHMCGNPRRFCAGKSEALSWQERRRQEADRLDLAEALSGGADGEADQHHHRSDHHLRD